MKIFLVILLSLVLALAVAINAAAAPVLLYLDTLPNGTADISGEKNDLSFTIVSGGTMFGKFKVGAEYGLGKIEGTSGDKDAGLWSVKGGYRLLDLRATKLDGIVATIMIDTKQSGVENSLDSINAGFDFTQYFSEKLFLTASVVYSVDASYDYALGEDDDVPVSLYRVKLHYFLNDNWGAVLGYTDLNYEFDAGTKVDVSLGGFHLGVLHKF